MSEVPAATLYEFAGFRLQIRQRLLFSCDSRPVPLSPRAFETLVALVEQAGEMVEKSDLMRRVWPKTVVEENSLNQCISQLRRALGERPGEHRFIVTVPGRGYRFVADVSAVSDAATGSRGALATTSISGERTQPARGDRLDQSRPEHSVAVLPFTNLTGDPSKDYLGEGIADELIHTLSRVRGLKIPARSSSFAYKGRQVGVRQIAEELRVKAVLEGSVRSAGERIRVTVQLIDADSGYQSWSQSLDRKFEDLFALQDELARDVARTLQLGAEPAPGAPPHNFEAYMLMMRACYLRTQASEPNLRESIGLLKRAVQLDASLARAHAWLAMVYMDCISFQFPVADALIEAERAAEAALNLDPGIPDVHAALGVLGTMRGRWVESAARFETAVSLSTERGWRLWRASVLLASAGQVRESLREMDAGWEQDTSAAAIVPFVLAVIHTILMNDSEARRCADLAVSLGWPRNAAALPDIYAQLAWRARRFDEAAAVLTAGVAGSTQASVTVKAIALLCEALSGAGDRQAALGALRDLEAKLAPTGIDHFTCKRLLLWYTMLGAPDLAHECAAHCLDTYAKSGTVGSAWSVIWMPEMRPFRSEPRFQDFVRRVGLPAYWEQYGPPDDCEYRGGTLILN